MGNKTLFFLASSNSEITGPILKIVEVPESSDVSLMLHDRFVPQRTLTSKLTYRRCLSLSLADPRNVNNPTQFCINPDAWNILAIRSKQNHCSKIPTCWISGERPELWGTSNYKKRTISEKLTAKTVSQTERDHPCNIQLESPKSSKSYSLLSDHRELLPIQRRS